MNPFKNMRKQRWKKKISPALSKAVPVYSVVESKPHHWKCKFHELQQDIATWEQDQEQERSAAQQGHFP